jgi:hypothetical protein
MAYASIAVAAMEAHRTVVGVVQNGLWLLANLSAAHPLPLSFRHATTRILGIM